MLVCGLLSAVGILERKGLPGRLSKKSSMKITKELNKRYKCHRLGSDNAIQQDLLRTVEHFGYKKDLCKVQAGGY